MSTVAEIEEAIARLAQVEKMALESSLVLSLDEAEAEIERGECFTSEEMRTAVRSWTGG